MKIGQYKQGLGIIGQKMFDNLRVKYQLKGDQNLLILRIIAESWETIINCSQIIQQEGSSFSGLHGPKPHPEIAISKDAKQQLLKALKSLNLEEVESDPLLQKLGRFQGIR